MVRPRHGQAKRGERGTYAIEGSKPMILFNNIEYNSTASWRVNLT